jgi:hypothetical protein
MLAIHKYRLPFHDAPQATVKVEVRSGALMHVAMQDGEVHVWAAVDPSTALQPVWFHLVGTGGEVDPKWYHLGTVIDGIYVWHIFSEPRAIGGPPIHR